jgi:hypothetical protein
MPALILLGRNPDDEWVWDYSCDCGCRYRVARRDGVARFWPSNSNQSFSARSPGEECEHCGRALSIEGCVIDASPTISADAA